MAAGRRVDAPHNAHRWETTVLQRGSIVVRRQVLAPGDATGWHVDPHHRVTMVLRGDALRIEFGDGGEAVDVAVQAGQVDWDEPSARVHRAVNNGDSTYEEVTVFLLDHPDAAPQPPHQPA